MAYHAVGVNVFLFYFTCILMLVQGYLICRSEYSHVSTFLAVLL